MMTVAYGKAVIFNEHGQVLLLRRSLTDDKRPGERDFPGGGVEAGEDFTAAVAREIREEAGLAIADTDLTLFYAATQAYPDRSVTRLLFWARVPGAEIRLSHEHEDYQWVDPAAVYAMFPHPFYGAGMVYGLEHGLFK